MRKKKTVQKPLKVKKEFMTNYLKVLFLLCFALICAIFVSHHISLTQIKSSMIENSGNTNLQLEVLQQQSIIFYKLMIATVVCFFIATCILTARLTKNVSRPVEEFINHLNKIPHLSQARKIRFRKGQTFEELGKTFNFLLQKQEFQPQPAAIHNYRQALK